MPFLRAFLLTQMTMVLVEGLGSDFCPDNSFSFHADPEDCTRFYTCFSKVTFHFLCPPGLFFNPDYSVCDYPSNVDCGQNIGTSLKPNEIHSTKMLTSSAPTSPVSTPLKSFISTLLPYETSEKAVTLPDTTAPENATQTPSSPKANFCQSRSDGVHADPEYCDGFYKCSNSFPYHFTCQEELLFNPELEYCDWEWNVNCTAPRDNRYRSQYTSYDENSETVPTEETTVVNSTRAANCGKVVCYLPNWAIYRRGIGARFGPEDVNPELCTHLIYAFATLRGNRVAVLESADDPSGSDIGNFARVTNLKRRNPRLKVLLAVGGWNTDPHIFSKMAANQDSRTEFINTTIELLRNRSFDGLDLDWEYPNSGESPVTDKGRYARLCEEIRTAFDKEASGENRLIFAGAVAAGKNTIDTSYDVPRLAAAFDIINVMSYDLHGSWDRKTGHNSPLKAGHWEANYETTLNLEWVANYWARLGAPRDKLVIGVPLYARTFTLESTSNTGVGAPSTGPGLPGKYTAESGYLSYYEICTMFNHSSKYLIVDQRVPYLVSDNQWIGYDDPTSVREKVEFIKDGSFGGVMVWDLSHDDFSGRFCGEGSYPLLNAIINQCVSPDITSSTTVISP